MLCSDGKKLIEFLGGAEPAFVVEVGLVPYLPIFYAPVTAVRPALVHVHDDVLTDDRPLVRVGGRQDAVMLRPMLDLAAEAVKGLGSRKLYVVEIHIGQREVIGFG